MSWSMTGDQKAKNLIRSKYPDVMVKIDTDVYHLNKLQLALKSDYFEKLFTDDFQERNYDQIELSVMDSDTFSVIVDVMYGEKLNSVLTKQNFVSVFIAMDYLQIGINMKTFVEFLEINVSFDPAVLPALFELYNFVLENPNFKALLLPILEIWSHFLTKVGSTEEFLRLPFEHLIKLISFCNTVTIECMRSIGQMCADWIWHDIENRLPHALTLVNFVRRRMQFPYGVNGEKLLKKLHNISPNNISREKLLTYFQQLLFHKGEIITHDGFPESELNIEENMIDFNNENEQNKLFRFFENGDFYDVTIKVEEKTYKLHRFKLTSMCEYFAELFSAELSAETSIHPERRIETSTQLNKDIEYSLDGIAQTTFEMILRYIYLNEKIELTSNNIDRVLKATRILKVNKLMDKCYRWMMVNFEIISSEVAVYVMMNSIRENGMLGSLSRAFFCKHVPALWPEIGDNVSLFRSVSFDMLKEILLFETEYCFKPLNLSWNFCVDDQRKLLDICSKWIIHDVENRYHLIPQVALAVNGNCMVDCDDYLMETPTDFNNCSQQFVRGKLKEILCSTMLVHLDASLQNKRREFEEEPAFISLTKENNIIILNADLNPIVSLMVYEGSTHRHTSSCKTYISATMIRDNVFIFIMFWVSEKLIRSCFQVYNLSSKKFISLSCVPEVESKNEYNRGYTLLNCYDKVYCCFRSGYLLKYSMQLNRWTILSKCCSIDNVHFASDGKSIYRMYESGTAGIYELDIYNSHQNTWDPLPNLSLRGCGICPLRDLTFVNGNELTALFDLGSFIFSYNQWYHYRLPRTFEHGHSHYSVAVVGRCVLVRKIVPVHKYRLFHFSNQNRWELKKEVSSESCIKTVAVQRLNNVNTD